MKITETITRECCDPKDLKPYKGMLRLSELEVTSGDLRFCTYCGELWHLDIFEPTIGEVDTRFIRVFERPSASSAFEQLVKHGGAWVSSSDCAEAEIASAKVSGRWFQIGSFGFVRRKKQLT